MHASFIIESRVCLKENHFSQKINFLLSFSDRHAHSQLIIVKMVQELQHPPEDFFNLSTLAEVTLIAGKLSTTDINEIKNYINKSEDSHVVHSESFQENSKQILLYHDGKLNYESTKKKWKNNWENFNGQETRYKKLHHTVDGSPSSVSSKSYAFLSSSCSSVSSDDDSTKSLLSYSHKVFDRKKQRSFKQSSTESEYDFHFDNHHRERNYDAIKDASCDNSSSNEMAKSDENLNDKSDDGLMEFSSDRNSSESLDGKNDDPSMNDHICPECGKKYSTSKSNKQIGNVNYGFLTELFSFTSFKVQISPDTDKLIDHFKTRKLDAVRFVIKFMFRCQHFPCTCGLITRTVNVHIVVNHFQDRGCFKDTSEHTQVS